MNNALYDLIKTSNENDVLYFRFPYPSFILLRILKKPRKCKIVIEYQSIETLEWRLNGHFITLFIDLVLGGSIRKYSDAIVGVTDEITQYELKRSGNPNIKHITIGNGFNVNSVNLRKTPILNQKGLSLLFLARVDRWHGADRIIEGIASYSGSLPVKLHIAGTGAEIPNLKKMVDKLNLNNVVIFHGFVSGLALDNLFNQCHLAVGSLGIHRIGLKEGSILKAREYCARGIPYIIACSDTDFPDDFPYILRLPADESPIDIKQVIIFSSHINQDVDHVKKMRQYAIENLDWSVKMKKLKVFLEDLIAEDKTK